MGIQQLGAFGLVPSARSFFVNSNPSQQQQVSLYGGILPFTLKPTQAVHIPQGNWLVQPGAYSNVQQWDQASMMWRFLSGFTQDVGMLASDGSNMQLVNTTGGAVGAVVTAAGAGLINGFYGYNQALSAISVVAGTVTPGNPYLTITASAGGSLWNAFVGGAVNTAVGITNGGSGFVEAPNLIVVPPANQGSQPFIPATMSCTISGGVINAVTVTNQGAGYVSAPTVLVSNQEGDLTGAFGSVVLAPALTGSGALTAVTCASPGTASVGAVPTLTVAGSSGGGSATATANMNFSLISAAIATPGVAYGTSLPYTGMLMGGTVTAATVYTNPAIETALINPAQQPWVTGVSSAGGVPAVPVVRYGGYGFATAPVLKAIAGPGAIPTTDVVFTATVGGNVDTVALYPI